MKHINCNCYFDVCGYSNVHMKLFFDDEINSYFKTKETLYFLAFLEWKIASTEIF